MTHRPAVRTALLSVPASDADDWSLLYRAVLARLRQCVDSECGPAGDVPVRQQAGRWRDSVLDCLQALDQLHGMLASTLELSHQRDRHLFEVTDRLARLGAELEGSRDGERRAWHRAMHDDLTTLPNRAGFKERLTLALEGASMQQPDLAVLYLDLDEFKQVNDSRGHGTGDQVLRIVAARLVGAVRTGDLVGRVGGDEFVCLLHGPLSREQVRQAAGKLLDTIAEPVKCGEQRFSVRPSIGVALSPVHGRSAEVLLDRADTAMYVAKRQRAGIAFYDGAAGS